LAPASENCRPTPPTASRSVLDGRERPGRFGELRQPFVVSSKQIELVEDLVVLERREASTDGARPVAVKATLFGTLGVN
jgi:hypothetical protein